MRVGWMSCGKGGELEGGGKEVIFKGLNGVEGINDHSSNRGLR